LKSKRTLLINSQSVFLHSLVHTNQGAAAMSAMAAMAEDVKDNNGGGAGMMSG
jgi:hypothetical protein